MIESNKQADDSDVASTVEQLHRDAALAKRVRYTGISPVDCDECGDHIEEARRRLLPGVRLCVSCARLLEEKGKR